MIVDMSKHFTAWQLIRYSLPSIAMMIFTSIYGIVDGLFVSNFAGKTAFASVNLIMPFVMILSVTGFMIGTGGSALVAKTRGEGKEDAANRYFTMLVIFALALGIVLAIVGFITMDVISVALGATDEMLAYCVSYGRILMISLPLYSLQYAFQSFFVTAGKPSLGFGVIVIAGVANMILDAVLIGALGLGVEGAAAATCVSEYLGGGIPLVYFARKNSSYLRFVRTKIEWRAIGKACVNGSSEMVTNIAMSLVAMLYNFQLMAFIGEEGVAAYGVIMYTAMVFAAIFMGYNIGTSPLLSFQYGAQNRIEMRSIMMKSLFIVGASGIAMFALSEALAEPICYIFTSYDQNLYNITVNGFRIYAICYLLIGYSMYGSAFFTALNNGLISALISFLRTLVFETASVILLPMIIGVNGIWLSVTVAEAVSLIVTATCMIGFRKRYGYGKKYLEGKGSMLASR